VAPTASSRCHPQPEEAASAPPPARVTAGYASTAVYLCLRTATNECGLGCQLPRWRRPTPLRGGRSPSSTTAEISLRAPQAAAPVSYRCRNAAPGLGRYYAPHPLAHTQMCSHSPPLLHRRNPGARPPWETITSAWPVSRYPSCGPSTGGVAHLCPADTRFASPASRWLHSCVVQGGQG